MHILHTNDPLFQSFTVRAWLLIRNVEQKLISMLRFRQACALVDLASMHRSYSSCVDGWKPNSLCKMPKYFIQRIEFYASEFFAYTHDPQPLWVATWTAHVRHAHRSGWWLSRDTTKREKLILYFIPQHAYHSRNIRMGKMILKASHAMKNKWSSMLPRLKWIYSPNFTWTHGYRSRDWYQNHKLSCVKKIKPKSNLYL